MNKEHRFGYELDQDMGQLYFHSQGDKRIVGDIDLTLCWTTDTDIDCLHKHGSQESVEEHAAKLRTIDDSVQTLTVPWATLMHPEAGQAIIEEVNKCLEITGYVGRFEARLSEITADMDPTDDMMVPS